jgi:hypothetical protein
MPQRGGAAKPHVIGSRGNRPAAPESIPVHFGVPRSPRANCSKGRPAGTIRKDRHRVAHRTEHATAVTGSRCVERVRRERRALRTPRSRSECVSRRTRVRALRPVDGLLRRLLGAEVDTPRLRKSHCHERDSTRRGRACPVTLFGVDTPLLRLRRRRRQPARSSSLSSSSTTAAPRDEGRRYSCLPRG